MYLWDTNILRSHAENHPSVIAHSKKVPESEIALPSVVVAEVLRGRCDYALKAPPEKAHQAHQLLLETLRMLVAFQIVPFNQASANVFRQIATKNPSRKRYANLMIAAITIEGNHVVVTRNQKHFADLLPKHQLQNWIDDPPAI